MVLPLLQSGSGGCRHLQVIAIICTCTSRKSIQPSISLTEISVFTGGQGYSRPVSLTHGIILPKPTHSYIFFHFCSFNQRQRKRKTSKRKWQTLQKIQIRKFWVAGLLMQPFLKEKACRRKPVLQYKDFELRFLITLANTPKHEQF